MAIKRHAFGTLHLPDFPDRRDAAVTRRNAKAAAGAMVWSVVWAMPTIVLTAATIAISIDHFSIHTPTRTPTGQKIEPVSVANMLALWLLTLSMIAIALALVGRSVALTVSTWRAGQ